MELLLSQNLQKTFRKLYLYCRSRLPIFQYANIQYEIHSVYFTNTPDYSTHHSEASELSMNSKYKIHFTLRSTHEQNSFDKYALLQLICANLNTCHLSSHCWKCNRLTGCTTNYLFR